MQSTWKYNYILGYFEKFIRVSTIKQARRSLSSFCRKKINTKEK